MKNGLLKVAHGIFGWCSSERRSDRYGSIHLSTTPFEGKVESDVSYDEAGSRLRWKKK